MKGTKRFGIIKRQIERTFEGKHTKEELIEYLKVEIEKRDIKIENQACVLEINNRKNIPIKDRYLEILYVDSSTSKLTINPCDGRVTLKISNKSSEKVKIELIDFANTIMLYEKFEPITFRGKFYFKNNAYRICMESLSKRFSHYFIYEVDKV